MQYNDNLKSLLSCSTLTYFQIKIISLSANRWHFLTASELSLEYFNRVSPPVNFMENTWRMTKAHDQDRWRMNTYLT